MAYAIDGGPVLLWTPDSPETVGEIINGYDGQFCFHNAEMEWNILAGCFGIELPLERVVDSAACARHANLPGKLEELADFFGLEKDMAGHAVMMRLCRPRKPSKDNPGKFWTPETKPEDFQKLYAYCAQDVVVQRDCFERLPPMSGFETLVYRATFKANQRGLPADVTAAKKLSMLARQAKADLSNTIKMKYGFTLGQVAEIGAYLGTNDVAKATIRDLLKDPFIHEDHRALAEARQTFAKSSTAKIDALIQRASLDGRIHGGLIYGGAERTLRFSGAGFQAQNLVRGLGKKQAEAYDALDMDMLVFMYADILNTIAGMIRGLIHGGLYWGDYSQIECRLLAWFSGDTETLDIFRSGGDPYKIAASKIYRITFESVTPDQRFMGKQSVLACLESAVRVQTDRGWVQLIDVKTSDRLWDGEEWISHQGVIFMGLKPTIKRHGLSATATHLVLCGTKWVSWSEVSANQHVFQSALNSATSLSSVMNAKPWKTKHGGGFLFVAAVSVAQKMRSYLITSKKDAARDVMSALRLHQMFTGKGTGVTPASSLMKPTVAVCSTELQPSISGVKTLAPSGLSTTESEGSRLGSQIGARFLRTSSLFRDGISRSWSWIASTTIRGTRRGTSNFQPNQRTPATVETSPPSPDASQNLKPVYDIAHAGPRNRFTVLTDAGPIIVHNCGYGLGPFGFQALLDTTYDVQISDAEAKAVVDGYRQNNPKVVAFWKRIEEAMERASTMIGKRIKITTTDINLSIQFTDSRSFNIRLPSGRKLRFYNVEWDSKDGWSAFSRLKAGGYGQRKIYAGLLCGVIVQSTARELIARSIVRLDQEGFDFILTVHDENVVLGDGRYEKFKEVMMEKPDWLVDFPLGADIARDERYRK
jgi:hypothetical protein